MLFLKYMLMALGIGMFLSSGTILAYDFYLARFGPAAEPGGATLEPRPLRWRTSLALGMLAWAPLLLALSIVVVPAGMAAVRVSQVGGTEPGTLYAGVHIIRPLVDKVVLFDTRDQLFTTGNGEAVKSGEVKVEHKPELLRVQATEGLTLGLAITVRYRLDARRLDYILDNLPQPVEKELVPPIVASAGANWCPTTPCVTFLSARREEVRRKAADMITRKLAADGIVVKEVMLRDIQLPPEYAKGLESLLLKEQENDRMGVETEIQQKQVRTRRTARPKPPRRSR